MNWTSEQLADATMRNDAWHTRQSRLVLRHRAARGDNIDDAIAIIRSNFDKAETSRQRVQTLTTMHVIGATNAPFLRQQLNHDDEHVRVWAVRLISDRWRLDDNVGPSWQSQSESARVRNEASTWLPEFVRLAAEDESAMVRLTLASTLQRLPIELRPELAEKLVQHAEDADDHNLPLMIWYGLIPSAQNDAESLVRVAKSCRLPTTLRLISRCVAEEIETQPGAIDGLLRFAFEQGDDAFQETALKGISEGLRGWRSAPKPKAWALVAKADSPKVSLMVKELSAVFGDGRALEELKTIAMGKNDFAAATRIAALETLIQSEPADLRDICQSLLTDQKMNVVAARGLSKFRDPEIGKQLVKRYRNFRGTNRPQVISILCSRQSFAKELLSAIGKGDIPRSDLSAFQARQIHSFADPELSRTVAEVWGELRESSAEKKQAIEETKRTLIAGTLGKQTSRTGAHCSSRIARIAIDSTAKGNGSVPI